MMSVCIDDRDMFESLRVPLPAYCSTVACMTPDGCDVRDARERSENVVDALEVLRLGSGRHVGRVQRRQGRVQVVRL